MRVIVAICLFLGFTAGAAAQAIVDQPYVIGYGDRFTTAVYLNGQGPFTFVIDTAASKTVLYEHVRARLGLSPVRDEQITIFGLAGKGSSPPYAIAELRLADEKIGPLEVVVVGGTRGPPAEPDGVLGLDVLTRYLLVFDRPASRLKLFAPDSKPAPYIDWPGLSLEPRPLLGVSQEFWFLEARFERKRSRALLDLGSGLTILNWPLARNLGFHESQFSRPPVQVQDLLGRVSPMFILKGLHAQLGNRRWSDHRAVVADARLFELVGLANRPASIVGAGLLKDESFAVDFARKRLHIAPRR
jgi:hypothetical protein